MHHCVSTKKKSNELTWLEYVIERVQLHVVDVENGNALRVGGGPRFVPQDARASRTPFNIVSILQSRRVDFMND